MLKLKKIYFCLTFLLIFMMTTCVQPVKAEFQERPIAFVVLDHSGNVEHDIYKSWRSVVKWAYHFPYYKFIDNKAAFALLIDCANKNNVFDKELLANISNEVSADVLVVVRIYDLEERFVTSFGFNRDHETYVNVRNYADLLVYKKEENKFLKKRLRENKLREIGNYEHPEETIKWELSKLVNTMENRPIIGS